MRARIAPLACLAMVASLASPVHAEAVATARLTNLTFTLIDLDPNDGITPSFSFISAPGNDLAYTYSVHSMSAGYESLSGMSTGFGSPLSKQVAFPDTSASLLVDDGQGRYQMEAKGSSVDDANFSAALNFTPSNAAIQLTGNTQLIISGDATVFTQVDKHVTLTCVYYDTEADTCGAFGYNGSYASATASMNLSGPTGGGGTSYSSANRTASSSAASSYRYGEPLWQDKSGELAVSFATLNGESQTLNFSLSLISAGTSVAVPEPQGWGLALAGLAVSGAWTRRQRRSRQARAQGSIQS